MTPAGSSRSGNPTVDSQEPLGAKEAAVNTLGSQAGGGNGSITKVCTVFKAMGLAGLTCKVAVGRAERRVAQGSPRHPNVRMFA